MENEDKESVFYKMADNEPTAIYVVSVWKSENDNQIGLFSTRANAQKWMDSFPFSCACSVFIVDDPLFGNRVLS